MTKYIDADALIEAHQYKGYHTPGEEDPMVVDVQDILDFPAAPVRREVHAAWEKKNKKILPLCSNCGKPNYVQPNKFTAGLHLTPFCPHCGATMDLDTKGAEG